MVREPNIPLFLWIATAVLIHLATGGSAERVVKAVEERVDVRRFAESVRRHVRLSAQPVEVTLLDPTEDVTPERPSHADDENDPEDDPAAEDPPPPDEKAVPETKKPQERAEEEPEKKPVEPEPPKPEAKAEKQEETKQEEKKAEELTVLKMKNRIAVEQHVEDKEQEDNPDAEFIGDHANRVAEQTQARITSTDQNDPSPTPGSAHSGPTNEPGNAHVTDIAQSEDVPGEMDRAPSEQPEGARATASSSREESGGGDPAARELDLRERAGRSTGAAEGRTDPSSRQDGREGRAALAETPRQDAVADPLTSPEGRGEVDRGREGRHARRRQEARPGRLPPPRGSKDPTDLLGLGSEGRTPNGINLNLSHGSAAAAIGRDTLQQEKLADGERRRSKHRGSWTNLGIERWRAAIENYASSVKPGNQTALNTARVPFASYLNRIHNRLHPIFADSFLGSLSDLPKSHPLNRSDMKTNLEIVLDRENGKVVKMGVTRSSGSTMFDIAALEAVQSASPFGKPPKAIVSPDGNVYLHWEFHRNPFYACSTYFARPYILKAEPKSAPPNVRPPARPFGPKEQPLPREGRLEHGSPDDSRHRQNRRTHAAR